MGVSDLVIGLTIDAAGTGMPELATSIMAALKGERDIAVVQSGGSFQMPLSWTIMAVLGIAMVAIFMHIRFALYKRLDRAVVAEDWPAGGAELAKVRTWVAINLGLGVVVLLVTLMQWTT